MRMRVIRKKSGSRAAFLQLAMGCILAFGVPTTSSHAQSFPERPVKVVVSYPAGGTLDAAARPIMSRLTALLGQPVVVENVVGAGGAVGAAAVARAPADGYTLLFTDASPILIQPKIVPNLGYNGRESFSPISQVVSSSMTLITRLDLPFASVSELVAYARANPGKLNYGSSGIGGTQHLMMEMFAEAAGINMVHVPYKGAPQIITDLIGGQIHLAFVGTTAAIPVVESGKLRGLGISILAREPKMPNVPAIADSLPGFGIGSWYGLFAPAGTPAGIVGRIQAALTEALRSPDVVTALESRGLKIEASTAEAFSSSLEQEQEKWLSGIASAGLKDKKP